MTEHDVLSRYIIEDTGHARVQRNEEVPRMDRLAGRRAVVTGAASGLGRSLCGALARNQWRVGIVDINDSGSEETLELVELAGGTGEVMHADVSIPERVTAVADHFFEEWGGVDLLINDAGVAVVGPVGDVSLDDWDWIFGVNFFGMMYGCHEFIPRMKEQGEGHIVNVASAAGLISSAEMAPYNSTKAAVVALSETLRVEVAPSNIGVTVACPMFFKTGLIDTCRYTDPTQLDFARTCFDCSRITADEVAEAILRAVERNKLYVVMPLSGKVFWMNYRATPERYYENFRQLNIRGWMQPVLDRMARWGLL